jgi:hypothetical protein
MQKTVREIVANALDATGNDFLKAVDLMKKQVTADPKLYRELLDPFLGKACYVQVKKECRRRGVALSNTKPPTLEEGRAQVRAMAEGEMVGLMGKSFSDATPEEIRAVLEGRYPMLAKGETGTRVRAHRSARALANAKHKGRS